MHKENEACTRCEILSRHSLSYTSMATNADHLKWCEMRISVASAAAEVDTSSIPCSRHEGLFLLLFQGVARRVTEWTSRPWSTGFACVFPWIKLYASTGWVCVEQLDSRWSEGARYSKYAMRFEKPNYRSVKCHKREDNNKVCRCGVIFKLRAIGNFFMEDITRKQDCALQ